MLDVSWEGVGGEAGMEEKGLRATSLVKFGGQMWGPWKISDKEKVILVCINISMKYALKGLLMLLSPVDSRPGSRDCWLAY